MQESSPPFPDQETSRSLRILLSAYACEPGKGSEPGTGWNLALALAKSFEVTVVTRANNREPIEQALETQSTLRPSFIYHDLPPFVRFLKKKGILPTQVYYALWQRSLSKNLANTQDLRGFDLFHHITFNSFEVLPGLLESFPGIKVWGPIGGGQRAPVSLTTTLTLRATIKERLRSWRILLSRRDPRLIRCLEACDSVLFANEETRDLFKTAKLKSNRPMIDVGVDAALFTPSEKSTQGLRIFSAGNFEARKGTRLLLLAFQRAHRKNPNLRLHIAGDGPELPRDRVWVDANSLSEVITFSGKRSHVEMAEEFADADLFVFPSIRDTSGAIVLEAMACGLPVVCLDHQGGRLMVGENAGIRVKPQSLELTIQGLAAAILELSDNTLLRESLGKNARARVLHDFTWEKKAEQLADIYQRLCYGAGRL